MYAAAVIGVDPVTALRTVLGLLGWLAASYAAAGIGAIASGSAPDFYAQLERPVWAPPAWLFGPVWTVLYALIAVAAWLVWHTRGFSRAPTALTLFLVQLGANALWTWLFFAWRLGAAALAEILVLWVLIAMTLIAFWRVHRIAGLLLVPYFAWVSYAAALTYALWRLNPQQL